MLELLVQHEYLMAENRIMKAQQSNPCDRRKLSDAKVKIPSAQTLPSLRIPVGTPVTGRPPPGQIRACAANALGSHLGCLTMKRCCG